MIKLLEDIAQCKLCEPNLSHGARPVLQVDARSKILVAGQAPGRKVHESGIPFNDASGRRLRNWMGIDDSVFYDASKIAIVPMGFCYPGKGTSGDLPPRPECAERWRSSVLSVLSNIQLTLVIGQYALAYHCPDAKKSNLTDTVRNWEAYWPHVLPLPHPSPRNNIWLKKNPWFEVELLPKLQERVGALLRS